MPVFTVFWRVQPGPTTAKMLSASVSK